MSAPGTATSSSRRVFFAWAVIAALALQSLLPMGFMPGVSAIGGTTVVICGGHAHNSTKPVNGHSADHQTVCPFAAAAVLFTPPASFLIALPVSAAAALMSGADFHLSSVFSFGNAAPRAPPSFS